MKLVYASHSIYSHRRTFYPFHSIMNYKRMFDVILMQHNGTKECFMSPNCSTVFSIIAQQTALGCGDTVWRICSRSNATNFLLLATIRPILNLKVKSGLQYYEISNFSFMSITYLNMFYWDNNGIWRKSFIHYILIFDLL